MTKSNSRTCAIGLEKESFVGLLQGLRAISEVETFPSAAPFLKFYSNQDSLPRLIVIGPELDPETALTWALQFKGLPVAFYIVPEADNYDQDRIIEDIGKLFPRQQDLSDQISLNLAQEIQEKLLPAGSPDCPGYEFDVGIEQNGPVGGDFYWFQQTEQTLLLAVGDVSGRGLSAALLVGFTQELFESVEHLSLKTIRRLNRQLCLKTPDEVSVACTFVEIELTTGRFKFCNAGNPPLAALGADRRIWDHRQPSLGWLVDYPYAILKGYLAPGELLTLFSDGVSEDTILETELPAEGLSGWASGFLASTPSNEQDDRVLVALRRGKVQRPTFDWKYAFDSVARRLERIKPLKLFGYTKTEEISTAKPTGGFTPMHENAGLLLGRYNRGEFAQALFDHRVIDSETPLEITANDHQEKLARSVTVRDRRTNDLLFILRGHLGSWTFESPVDEERVNVAAYLIDQLYVSEKIKLSKLHKFLVSSLNETTKAYIALPDSFDLATKYRKAGFVFLDPIAGGRFLAMARDLVGLDISDSLKKGRVMLLPDNKIVTWKTKEMILSNDEMWSQYFVSARYKKMKDSAHHLHRYERVYE